jgi:hypothetical protein
MAALCVCVCVCVCVRHLKHAARHMASLPYACRNISKVSAPDLPSLTQNLMLARCSIFKSMLTSQTWLNRWWRKLVLCNSQCSHIEATWHTEWRRFQLSITANNIHIVPSVGGLCEIVYELFDTPTQLLCDFFICGLRNLYRSFRKDLSIEWF